MLEELEQAFFRCLKRKTVISVGVFMNDGITGSFSEVSRHRIKRDLARGTQIFILGPVPGGEGWESRPVSCELPGSRRSAGPI